MALHLNFKRRFSVNWRDVFSQPNLCIPTTQFWNTLPTSVFSTSYNMWYIYCGFKSNENKLLPRNRVNLMLMQLLPAAPLPRYSGFNISRGNHSFFRDKKETFVLIAVQSTAKTQTITRFERLLILMEYLILKYTAMSFQQFLR